MKSSFRTICENTEALHSGIKSRSCFKSSTGSLLFFVPTRMIQNYVYRKINKQPFASKIFWQNLVLLLRQEKNGESLVSLYLQFHHHLYDMVAFCFFLSSLSAFFTYLSNSCLERLRHLRKYSFKL